MNMFKAALDRYLEAEARRAVQQRKAQKSQRAERRRHGLCTTCGNPPEKKGARSCDACRLKDKLRKAGIHLGVAS